MKSVLHAIKRHWLMLTLIMVIATTTLSLWPAEHLPKVPGTDKLHHLLTYAFLVIPVALSRPRRWPWVVVTIIAMSGAIELIQPFVNRYGEWLDMAANVTGVMIGVIIATVLNKLLTMDTKQR